MKDREDGGKWCQPAPILPGPWISFPRTHSLQLRDNQKKKRDVQEEESSNYNPKKESGYITICL